MLIGNATLGSTYFLKISGASTSASLKITESVTPNSPSVAKSGTAITPLVFTVVLSAPRTTATTVAYATADGTAVAGKDYSAETGTLTFAPGVTSQTVTVPILPNTTYGPSETFTLQLSNPGTVRSSTIPRERGLEPSSTTTPRRRCRFPIQT